MNISRFLISNLCNKNSVLKNFYEDKEELTIDDIVIFLEEYDLTKEDFVNILNETVSINSFNTELFIKLANFIHNCGIKEQILLNCIDEQFSKDILDKLPECVFNQDYLNKDCPKEDLIKSLKQEPCFGIFKSFWDNEINKNDYDIYSLITSNLKYLKHVFDSIDKRILCTKAAENGHLDCLKYLHENGCLWDEDTCSWAAFIGHLDCLKYAHENGCSWNKDTCECAALNGHLDCLKYAHENGCPWDVLTCENAAKYGHLDCLKYAHENGCPWDECTCAYATTAEYLDCLKYAHENGCEWDECTCIWAAKYGNLDCLKYAYENGCPWNYLVCENAAKYGHLDCLKYAHENGCEWDDLSSKYAAENEHFDCLKYLHENGCNHKFK